jgi:hypothetical protein
MVMENFAILARWAIVALDFLLIVLFGMASSAALFFVMFLQKSSPGGHALFSMAGLAAIATVAAMWCLFGGWFVYGSNFRHERVKGYWLPLFWIAALGICYGGPYLIFAAIFDHKPA